MNLYGGLEVARQTSKIQKTQGVGHVNIALDLEEDSEEKEEKNNTETELVRNRAPSIKR